MACLQNLDAKFLVGSANWRIYIPTKVIQSLSAAIDYKEGCNGGFTPHKMGV